MSERVIIDREGPVARVTLNRPEAHNCLDRTQFEAIVAAGEGLKSMPGLRAVILTGAGPDFCAGLDPRDLAAILSQPTGPSLMERTHPPANLHQQASLVWTQLRVPVIAAIHGQARGGGLQLALAADIRIAAPDSGFAIHEARLGLVPDMGLSVLAQGQIRPDMLRRLTWTAENFNAEDALGWGFITEIAQDPQARAEALVQEIAARSPDAVQAAKAVFRQNSPLGRGDIGQVLMTESGALENLVHSPNTREAIEAFAETRPPRFKD